MSATVTLTSGPSAIGPGLKMATYSVALPNSYTAGGEPIDLSGEFTRVYAILVGGNDDVNDNQYQITAVWPKATVAVTDTNCKISVQWDRAAAASTDPGKFAHVTTTTDLAAIGFISITVIGK